MAVTAQWVLNKVKEKIYTKANAEYMVRGTSTVDRDISNIAQEADGIYGVSQSVQSEEFKSHSAKMISSGEEIHGFRYADEELQVNDGSDWVTLISGKEVGGGLNPPNMKSVRIEPGEDETQLLVYGTDPDDFELDHLKSIWGGTKVVRKVGGYPENPDDGVLVVDYQTRNQYADAPFVDTGLVLGETYYYRWFPYSNTGVVNYSETGNRAIGTPVEQFGDANVVGVIVDLKNNLVTRLNKASNVDSDSMTIDELTNKFNELSPIYKDRRKCIVADDRTILAFYGDQAYTETGKLEMSVTKNGTTYAVSTPVQVMVYQPKFWYKLTPIKIDISVSSIGTEYRYMRSFRLQISDKSIRRFKVHPAFVRAGVEHPYILLAAYEAGQQDINDNYSATSEGTGEKTKTLCSVANTKPFTYENTSIGSKLKLTSLRKLAQNRGPGWQLHDILASSVTQMLFLVEFASFNSQAKIGMGHVQESWWSSGNLCYSSGKTSSLGNGSGKETDTDPEYGSVTYRGEENLWGDSCETIEGVYGAYPIITTDKGTSEPNQIWYTDQGYAEPNTENNSVPSEPYKYVGYTAANGGYISAFGYSEDSDFLFVATEVGGDSSNPVGDYWWGYNSGSYEGCTVAVYGGGLDRGSNLGLPGLFTYEFGKHPNNYPSPSAGGRIMCIPTIEDVSPDCTLGVEVDFRTKTYTRLGATEGLTGGADFNNFRMYQRRKCIVADDRTILAFYGDQAYTETGKLEMSVTKNGTTYDVGSNVQVMVYQPKFYYKVTPLETEETGNGTVLRKARYEVASNPPESGNFKVHPAFKRNGVEYPYILLAAYEGTYQDADNNYDTEGTARHSKSGKYASIANSATQFQGNYSGNGREKSRTLCNNRGEGWQLLDIMSISCTQLLFLIEYATFDSQTAIGKGACPVSNLPTGTTSSLGNNSGTVIYNETTGYLVVSYRGEESLWGNKNSWIDGLIATPTEKEIYWADHDFYCEDYQVPERDPAADISKYPSYQPAGFKIPRISNWITGFGYSAACDWMFIPIEVSTEPDPSRDAYNASIGDWCFCDNEEEQYGLYRFNLPNIGGYDRFNSSSVFKKCEGAGLFNFWNHMTPTGSGTLYNARMICIPPEGAKAEY